MKTKDDMNLQKTILFGTLIILSITASAQNAEIRRPSKPAVQPTAVKAEKPSTTKTADSPDKKTSSNTDSRPENRSKTSAPSTRQTAKITGTRTSSGRIMEYPKSGTISGHEYVDLGLSVKWATSNGGANSPDQYGDHYAWGETWTKSDYNSSSCSTWEKDMFEFTGNSKYDFATSTWGPEWRTPTTEEFDELLNKCSREWYTLNGIRGFKITGPNGNWIFLPAAGAKVNKGHEYAGNGGYYWTSTPSDVDNQGAWSISFDLSRFQSSCTFRQYGMCIRPVSGKAVLSTRLAAAKEKEEQARIKAEKGGDSSADGESKEANGQNPSVVIINGTTYDFSKEKNFINSHEYVDLGLSVKWATCNIGAYSPDDYGSYFAWGEKWEKSTYSYENSSTLKKKMDSICGDPEYDVATEQWGGPWRLPTAAEIEELVNKCKSEWVTEGGRFGRKFTGPNGNSIFLPASGWKHNGTINFIGANGGYWSGSAIKNNNESSYQLYFVKNRCYRGLSDRRYGLSVRAVAE